MRVDSCRLGQAVSSDLSDRSSKGSGADCAAPLLCVSVIYWLLTENWYILAAALASETENVTPTTNPYGTGLLKLIPVKPVTKPTEPEVDPAVPSIRMNGS